MSGNKTRMLKKGEDVHVISKVNSYWLKVKLKDGKTGYISASPKYTDYNGNNSSTDSSSKADRIISLAKSYIDRVSYMVVQQEIRPS